jgi:trimethylamine:corrinoid methyltransferase-like protein
MQPHLRFLSDDVINQITDDGLALLIDPGVRVENAEALELLASAGADVDFEAQVAHIPEDIVRTALETAPSDFDLYDLNGEPVVHYGADSVQFARLKAQYERRD